MSYDGKDWLSQFMDDGLVILDTEVNRDAPEPERDRAGVELKALAKELDMVNEERSKLEKKEERLKQRLKDLLAGPGAVGTSRGYVRVTRGEAIDTKDPKLIPTIVTEFPSVVGKVLKKTVDVKELRKAMDEDEALKKVVKMVPRTSVRVFRK